MVEIDKESINKIKKALKELDNTLIKSENKITELEIKLKQRRI